MDASFLLDYEVEAHGCLPDKLNQVVSNHPCGHYQVFIANLSTEPGVDRPLLAVQIIINAPDIATAKDVGKQALSRHIDMLTFATNLKFEIRKLVRIIDWTPGLRERRCMQYQPFPGHELPIPVLSSEVCKSVEVLEEAEISDRMRRVLRWFARGVRSPYPDDQFQYFWFVVELLAQMEKSTDKVNDLCSKCRSPLHCETCDEYPTHRPYPKQAILGLFRQVITDEPDAFFEKTNRMRNCLLHGDDIKAIEVELDTDISSMVDKLGNVAWVAIYRSLVKSFKGKPSQERLALIQTNTYTHRTMTIAADLMVYGDADHSKLAQFAKPEISMVYNKRDRKPDKDGADSSS